MLSSVFALIVLHALFFLNCKVARI